MIPTAPNESISRTALMYLAIDSTFYLNGLICFLVNYKLAQIFPDVFERKLGSQTTTPNRKYLLLFVSLVSFLTILALLIDNIKTCLTCEDGGRELKHIISILYTLIISISAMFVAICFCLDV